MLWYHSIYESIIIVIQKQIYGRIKISEGWKMGYLKKLVMLKTFQKKQRI